MSEEKIDIVYTWVNGQDPEWEKEKSIHLKDSIKKNAYKKDEIGSHRYTDNNELLYSIRSLYLYANWFNKIYIITDKQVPTWLKSFDRICIIDHLDIMPKNILPTYNSSVIEAHIHNIKNLNEKFIYFNDDMLIGRSCSPSDFFKGDKPRIFTSSLFPSFKKKNTSLSKLTYNVMAIKNSRDIVNKKIGKRINYGFRHGVKPMIKSRLNEISHIYAPELDTLYSQKFRLSPFSLIYCYSFHELANKLAYPTYQKSIKKPSSIFIKSGFYYVKENNLKYFSDNFSKLSPLIFCINELSQPLNKFSLFNSGKLSQPMDFEYE
ncbi:stealth family protein [Vibrio sp. RC27]